MSAPGDSSSLPPLSKDPSFFGFLCTQFLGAFNDNIFKQMVLLLCLAEFNRQISSGHSHPVDLQSVAMALFAGPFVLFSGFAGFLSDRFSKRRIVVLAKVAEIAIMLAATITFYNTTDAPTVRLYALLVVLGCMGTQSAFFGPAKYGILPELFRDRDLPAANGLVQMTTFLAIIFGTALAGFLMDWYGDALWIAMNYCVGIAFVGTLTAAILRQTAIARPGLPFQADTLGIPRDIRKLLKQDRLLLRVLLVATVFWFLGGLTQPAANALGKTFFHWSDGRTSFLTASIGFGICVGCVVAGRLSRGRVNFGITRLGCLGLIVGFLWLTSFALRAEAVTQQSAKVAADSEAGGSVAGENKRIESRSSSDRSETFAELAVPLTITEWESRLAMFWVGVSAGLFVVPLQVFLQARPPDDQKGRMIGAMNLVTWTGIVLSSVAYSLLQTFVTASGLPFPWLWLALVILLVPVLLLFRPENVELSETTS